MMSDPTAAASRVDGGFDLGATVFSQDVIEAAVDRLADEISADYHGTQPVVVGVLPGAYVFLADLTRALTIPVEVDVMAISRFGPPEETGGEVHVQRELEADIVDTGLTAHYLLSTLIPRDPASIRIAALLERPNRRLIRVPLDYVGFEAPESFLVGYGLGHGGRFRQLPYVAQYPAGPPSG
jgi:hypoxanthine phosphoribosyltransferase